MYGAKQNNHGHLTRMHYLVRRNWEFWIACWLFSALDVLVVAVDCVTVVVTLLVFVRLVALRAVSSCCLAACACCLSNCSCICSCCNWDAEGPEELSCPPADRLTPDSWDKSSANRKREKRLKSILTKPRPWPVPRKLLNFRFYSTLNFTATVNNPKYWQPQPSILPR